MIICVCRRVSDRDIKRLVEAGCCSFEELQRECQVGTACGTCRDCARQTHRQACDEAVGASGQGPCAVAQA